MIQQDRRGIAHLANSPALAELERLSLSQNTIGHEGVRSLLESPHLGSLLWLDVHSHEVDDAMLAALRRRFPFVGPW